MGGWYAIVSADTHIPRLTPELSGDVSRLAALGAWRMTQGIYRFDPTLYDEIKKTVITGDLPCSVLYHLPEWCIYIETPEMKFSSVPLYGFFAHLEYDSNDHRHELRLLLDTEGKLIPIPVHLGEWSLDEALRRMAAEAVKYGAPEPNEYISKLRHSIEPLVSLILYVCSEAAEIGNESRKPKNPKPVKIKNGLRLFSPSNPQVWDVGVRIGAALRRAYQDIKSRTEEPSGRLSPRPHVRRAHWATYWTGSKKEIQKPILKWLPPIPVNVDDFDNLPSTIKKVKKEKDDV